MLAVAVSILRRHLVLLALGLLLLPFRAEAQKYQGRELVQAQLLADTSGVVPGKPFTAGLLLKMAPGWHTYWKYPGDAGIPTEIKWQLPPGWKAGEIQWPIPLKLTEPGDIQIYGYHDEVLLMMQLTPPEKLDGASVALPADVSWLVCEKICIPGSAKVQLNLPVNRNAAAANTDVFARFRAQLPRPFPTSAQGAISWNRDAKEFRLTIHDRNLAQSVAADFFPLPKEGTVIDHPRRESAGDDSVVFAIPFETADPAIHSLAGLIVYGNQPDGPNRQAWSLGQNVAGTSSSAAKPVPNQPGLLRILLFGFLGGLILNLMPCVLPVISLKIFGFIRHAGDSRRRIFANGLAFTAGIFAWFIGFALLLIGLKAGGREITWAFQFTNAWFVVAMSGVVLVFALNLFGVFEITLPAGASSGLVGWSAREGYTGSFFQGVFATLLATPCTAPYLGTALGFAFTQSAGIILLIFVAIATGMAAPYLLLSAQPAWLRFLPRPGPWMLRVKQLMGFLLLATLLFLLWVLGVERGLEATIWTAAFLLALSVACWIYGEFASITATFSARKVALFLMAALVFGSGFYFIGEKFRASAIAAAPEGLAEAWVAFTPDRLQTELAQGRSVFVDFTAAWCITCKFNESTVLESAPVKEAFARHGVVKMKADWTNADPAITKILKQFGRVGVPLYVLYPAASPDQPIVLPELLTQRIVVDHLQNAGQKVAARQ